MFALAIAVALTGCGKKGNKSVSQENDSKSADVKSKNSPHEKTGSKIPRTDPSTDKTATKRDISKKPGNDSPAQLPHESAHGGMPKRSLGDLIPDELKKSSEEIAQKRRKLDDAKLAAMGIRKLQGARLTLYTDLPSSPEIDRLPKIFDAAVDLWVAYFHLPADGLRDWSVQGYLIKDKALFTAAGILTPDLPPFPNGYTLGGEFWLYDQPSDYYRRHLMLHEGVHALTYTAFGYAATPWYLEGIAELLATHKLVDEKNGGFKLTIPYFPRDTAEVPMLGRIKLVREAYAENKGLRLIDVFRLGPQAHLQNQAYAWSWAAAAFLDGHPAYRDRFRKLPAVLRASSFTDAFQKGVVELFEPVYAQMEEEWRLFVATIEHGHDLRRTALDFSPGKPLPASGAKFSVAADRGWQNTQLQLEAGKRYRLHATGRYQVYREHEPADHDSGEQEPGDGEAKEKAADVAAKGNANGAIWHSEAGGITIRYYQGAPLGMLLAAVRPDDASASNTALTHGIVPIGLDGMLAPKQTGTLYLKINDSPGELDDNAGQCEVTIRAE